MPMLVYDTGLVSPRAEGSAKRLILDDLPENAESSGRSFWNATYPRVGRVLGYLPVPQLADMTAHQLALALAAEASKVFFTVRTASWRADRTEIIQWVSSTWTELELPGEPPADMLLRSGWKQREMYRRYSGGYSGGYFGGHAYAPPSQGFVRLDHVRGIVSVGRHLLALPRRDFS